MLNFWSVMMSAVSPSAANGSVGSVSSRFRFDTLPIGNINDNPEDLVAHALRYRWLCTFPREHLDLDCGCTS